MTDYRHLSAAEREKLGITLDDMLPERASLGKAAVNGQSLGTAIIVPEGDVRGTAVLIPGFTSSRATFFCIMDQLADAGYRVLAFSQRGQPESSGPTSADDYTLDELAHDVIELTQSLRVEGPIHLLGHSFGGLVGTRAVVLRPDVFDSFTLWNSGARNMGHTEQMEGGRDQVLAHGPRVVWVQDRQEKGLDPDADLRGELNPIEEFYFTRIMRTSPAQLAAGLDIMAHQEDNTASLAESGVRLLVSHGDADDAWPISQQQDDARRMGARYEVVPRAGHSAHQDNPVDSVRVLTEFWG